MEMEKSKPVEKKPIIKQKSKKVKKLKKVKNRTLPVFFIILLLGLSSLAIYEFTSYKEVADSKNKNVNMIKEQAEQTYRDLERGRKQAERGIFLQD